MGFEKVNLDIKMDFTNFHFHFLNFDNFFLTLLFYLKCYGTSMCGGKML
jgi:hypothetical protein